ncbi:MAG TPA: XdhC family protein [Candidatus Binatia bacterium]|nr:XdhC family protein [Candidatus Binatia bacterium]
MSDAMMRDVLAAWRAAEARDEPAVLATVVHVEGSGYRRPGARLLVSARGETVGAISGGCLETDLARRAWWMTASGPAVVSYDAGTIGEVDPRSGCGGVITVLVERLTPHAEPNPLDVIEAVQRTRRPGLVVTALDERSGAGAHHLVFPDDTRCGDVPQLRAAADHAIAAGLREGAHAMIVDGQATLVEVVGPPPALVVFGTGNDGHALVTFAATLGWDVTVTGSHALRARAERFPHANRVVLTSPDAPLSGVPLDAETSVAVMTHSLALDAVILHELRGVPLRYLGLLGPRHRTDGLLASLFAGDAPGLARMRARLHAPIGLDLGADGPNEIALAIVAEIRAVLAGRAGGRLRDRSAALHPAPLRQVASVLDARQRTAVGGRR